MIARLQFQPVEVSVANKKKRLTKEEKIAKAVVAANPGLKRVH